MKELSNLIVSEIEKLCGKNFSKDYFQKAASCLESSLSKRKLTERFSYRQLNELLLLCRERIVSKEFFSFLAGDRDTIAFQDFSDKVNNFRKLAMLQFGSFRFAFNYLCNRSNVECEFGRWLKDTKELIGDYRNRPRPIREIEKISRNKLHYLGYLIEDKVEDDELNAVRQMGQRNFETYLTYDYLDVYVATSMRKKWEYVDVNNLCNKVFNKRELREINVRYFDPTQNFHKNSIAKSLIEGLMLKRAKCTLYLVQETDTMGKDSEMASTLAQGKPVIAYVPEINETRRIAELKNLPLEVIIDKADLLGKLVEPKDLSKYKRCLQVILKLSEIADNSVAAIRKEMGRRKKEYLGLIELLAKYEKVFYDKRANTLKYNHPLRFQIDLGRGVANGVLVVRNPSICAKMIYKILTNDLDFDIVEPDNKIDSLEKNIDELNYRLVEKITKCAFRVVTKDEMLTNSFWNLYLMGEKEHGR